jgi:heme-degrading monooxygenase HmoA
MKIIGEKADGFILEASKNEISNLKGFYSSYSSEDKNKTAVGEEIEIKSIYSRYRAFENIIKSSQFKDALERIKDTIEVLTPVEELFNQTKEIIK